MKADPHIFLQAVIFFPLLSAASITDIRKREIPNYICIAIALTGLLTFTPVNLFGIMAALPFLITGIYCGGIGGGDIKLTAATGLVLGLKGAMVGTVLGLSAMLLFHALRKTFRRPLKSEVKEAYPLAPFLSLGFLAIYFYILGGKFI